MKATVEELNEAQADWMALDPHAPIAERKRVFALMERMPKVYVSGSDGAGVCIVDGQPTSMTLTFDKAMERCREYGGRTDVAWNGKLGKWYAVAPACRHCGSTTHPPGCCAQDGHGG